MKMPQDATDPFDTELLLRQLSTAYRNAMDACDFSDTQFLRSFPRESCDTTSKLLGLYLYNNAIAPLAIYSGNRPDCDGHHRWLQHNDIVVDITADQFPACNQPPVIVTNNSTWHSALDGYVYRQFDTAYHDHILERPWGDFLLRINDQILENLQP